MEKSKKKMLELWHKKPPFGSLYRTKGSQFIYISINYYKKRLRFPSDKVDTPENWAYLYEFLEEVGEKIKRGTFCFAKTFYWLDEETKQEYTALEGREYHPEPEHVRFEEFAEEWLRKNVDNFPPSRRTAYRNDLATVMPYFKDMSFASITTVVLEKFIDSYRFDAARAGRKPGYKRIKNLLITVRKLWTAARKTHNWQLINPFPDLKEKISEIKDNDLQDRERTSLGNPNAETAEMKRAVFLLAEWRKLLEAIDPHYHVVMELLLRGMIGSELEGLRKINIKDDGIHVRHKIVRESSRKEVVGRKVVKATEQKVYFMVKLKNWYRKRVIPVTAKLKKLLDEAMLRSVSKESRRFEQGSRLPPVTFSADEFVLTMADGTPFSYAKFYRTIWRPAIAKAGVPSKVPYASRHTLVQWALLIGVTKGRLVEVMGHCDKDMIDRVYGNYRKGLVDEREEILDYLGEDFLALEELKTFFPERYRALQLENGKALSTGPAFGQRFGQSKELYSDNYPKS